jgi:hypothetical protein
MAPKDSRKGQAKARPKMPKSVIIRCLSLECGCLKALISEQICGLIRIYILSGVTDEREWDLFYDIIVPHPVTTHHLSKIQPMWPHCRSSSSPFQVWFVAYCSDMRQMFDKTRNQMNN